MGRQPSGQMGLIAIQYHGGGPTGRPDCRTDRPIVKIFCLRVNSRMPEEMSNLVDLVGNQFSGLSRQSTAILVQIRSI